MAEEYVEGAGYPVDGTFTCPIHGVSDYVVQVATEADGAPDYRCYICWRENVIEPNCQVVTRTPP